MKKVVIENGQTVSVNNVSPDKIYVISYKTAERKNPAQRYALIRATAFENDEYEAISTTSFTRGNRYCIGNNLSLKGIIEAAISGRDDVFEFDSLGEAFTYLACKIID